MATCGAHTVDMIGDSQICTEPPGHLGDHIANGRVHWERDRATEAVVAELEAMTVRLEAAASEARQPLPQGDQDYEAREAIDQQAIGLDNAAEIVEERIAELQIAERFGARVEPFKEHRVAVGDVVIGVFYGSKPPGWTQLADISTGQYWYRRWQPGDAPNHGLLIAKPQAAEGGDEPNMPHPGYGERR
jgi:hypothetical protein